MEDLTQNSNSVQSTPAGDPSDKKKPGTFGNVAWGLGALLMLCIVSLLSILNTTLQGTVPLGDGRALPYLVGTALASFIVVGVVVLLFMIGKRFRNFRSIAKIAFFTALILALGGINNVSRSANKLRSADPTGGNVQQKP